MLNGLSFNPNKSESMVIGTGARQRHEGPLQSATLGDSTLPISDCVRNLGVTLDSTVTFNHHVTNNCKGAYCNIRALSHIRKCLTIDDAKTIASKLDYCNSLLHGISATNISKLHRVQNSFCCRRKYDHVTPILADLLCYRSLLASISKWQQ